MQSSGSEPFLGLSLEPATSELSATATAAHKNLNLTPVAINEPLNALMIVLEHTYRNPAEVVELL